MKIVMTTPKYAYIGTDCMLYIVYYNRNALPVLKSIWIRSVNDDSV